MKLHSKSDDDKEIYITFSIKKKPLEIERLTNIIVLTDLMDEELLEFVKMDFKTKTIKEIKESKE